MQNASIKGISLLLMQYASIKGISLLLMQYASIKGISLFANFTKIHDFCIFVVL